MEAIIHNAEQTAIPKRLETLPVASLTGVLLQMKASWREEGGHLTPLSLHG